MNKGIIITILLALVSLASQAQENSYTIRGIVDDPDVTVVYLEQQGEGYETLDSAIVTNGEFTMKGKVDKPVPAVVINKYRNVLYLFILEPGDITLKYLFSAVGGTLNDSLTYLATEYPRSIDSTLDDEARSKHFEQYAEAMFLRHKDDALGIRILDMCFASPTDKLRLYNMGGPMIKEYPSFVSSKETWAKYEATSEGKKMLDIQSAFDGKRLSHEKYKERGLQVLGLIVNDDKEDADKAIEQMGIPYPQIFGITFEQIASYGINGIPHIILFSPDGTILKRGLRGDGIEKALAKIFGE